MKKYFSKVYYIFYILYIIIYFIYISIFFKIFQHLKENKSIEKMVGKTKKIKFAGN